MKHTQYGLQPEDQYDADDYPLPITRVRTTHEYLDRTYGGAFATIHRTPILICYIKANGLGYKQPEYPYKHDIEVDASSGGNRYLPYPDMDSCSLVGLKISTSKTFKDKIYNMSVDELLIKYSDVK